MIPQIDRDVGMSVYSTASRGLGGRIRDHTDDFEVSEVLDKKALLRMDQKDGYAVYVLKKRGIDTAHALRQIRGRTGQKLKALGLKDARALTKQYVCAENRSGSTEGFESGNVSLHRAGFVQRPLTKKDMVGNRFAIKITGAPEGLGGFEEFGGILNYFGYQRFGSRRPVTHLIGKALVRRDFDLAVRLLLSFTSIHDKRENTELRERLADGTNFAQVLKDVPPRMDLERTVISEMIRCGDAKTAIRALPLSMRRFFVQAYQSFLFNLALSGIWGKEDLGPQEGDVCFDGDGVLGRYSGAGAQKLAVPLVGHSYYKKTRFDREISAILEEEQVRPKDFFIKEMQEISSAGGFRNSVIECKNHTVRGNQVSFTLSRGSYATMVLREIIKPKDPLECGF